MAFVQDGLAWLATTRKIYNSREVIYRRPSTGDAVVVYASIGQTQLVNLNSIGAGPDIADAGIIAAQTMNRDYIVSYSDLESIWPPQSGDLVDDEGDIEGSISRYQVMSLPSQDCWRWLGGGLQVQARVHTRFFAEYVPLWSDDFTGVNGTAINSHEPNTPDGGAYGGGVGGIVISSNRIVASDASAIRYFVVGSAEVSAQVDVCLNSTAGGLAGKYAEFGLGVRCASSGSNKRDGYYCTLKVGYADAAQTTKLLSIVSVVIGVETVVASVSLPSPLSLSATYRLLAECSGSRLVLSLLDSTGEVSLASVAYGSAGMTGQQSAAVIFAHEATIDLSLPYLDSLVVENVA